MAPNGTKFVQICPNRSKEVKIGPNGAKKIPKETKSVQMGQFGLKRSK